MPVDLIARGLASNAIWGTGSTSSVVGALSSIADDIVVFDGDTGKILKDGGHRISDLVLGNPEISEATHTKITYDSKGLVTGGVNAVTSDIDPSADRNYITDLQVINLSGLTSNVQQQFVVLNSELSGETNDRLSGDSDLLNLFTGRTITAGNAMVGGGNLSSDIILSHADTSNADNIISTGNTDGTILRNISLLIDTYGHVTGDSIETYDLDNRYYTETESDDRFINSSGDSITGKLTINNDLIVTGNTLVSNITGNTFVKIGGTWKQSLMADGSISAPSVITTSQNYSVQITDKIIKVLSPWVTITLPSAIDIAGMGFKIDNASSGNIYLTAILSQTIEDALQQIMPSNSCADVYSDGANYRFQ